MKTSKIIISMSIMFVLLMSTLVSAVSISIPRNESPQTPKAPRGETLVDIGMTYEWVAASTHDPDIGDMTKYCWDWGDGEIFEDNTYYQEGQYVTAEHRYTSEGIYEIRIKAIDFLGEESSWSDPLEVEVIGAMIYTDKNLYIENQEAVCTIENPLSEEIEITKISIYQKPPSSSSSGGGHGHSERDNIVLESGDTYTFDVSTSGFLGECIAYIEYNYNCMQYSDSYEFLVIEDTPPNATRPQGETNAVVDTVYTYTSSIESEYNIYYRLVFGSDMGRWIGPVNGVILISMDYMWNEVGDDYEVYVQTTYDITDGNIVDSETLIVNVFDNNAPEKPIIREFVDEGEIDTDYHFSANSTDPESDKIKYGWDWNGDMEVDEWTDFLNSSELSEITHLWETEGTYDIRVIAEDEKGSQSEWSEKVTVTINEDEPVEPEKDVSIEKITGFGKLRITLENNLDEDITDVNCSITVKGKMLFREYDETLSGLYNISKNDNEVVKEKFGKMFWFGKVNITVTVTHNGEELDQAETSGFMFGKIIFILPDILSI